MTSSACGCPPSFLTRPPMMPLSHGEWTPYDVIAFRDHDCTTHIVACGERVNGASIPRLLWVLVGHPMTTAFVYASALHDRACIDRLSATSKEVHGRFYRGVLCELLREYPPLLVASRTRRLLRSGRRVLCHAGALAMWAAVSLFGPQWSTP